MPEELDLVADRSKVDWPEIDAMSETIGQSDCLVTNTVALVVMRMRERADAPGNGQPTAEELHRACMFIRWKLNGFDGG